MYHGYKRNAALQGIIAFVLKYGNAWAGKKDYMGTILYARVATEQTPDGAARMYTLIDHVFRLLSPLSNQFSFFSVCF